MAGLDFEPTSGRFDPGRCYLVGDRPSGRALFVRHVEPNADLTPLRRELDAVPDERVAELFAAVALVNWHDSAGYCANCGGPTVPESAGRSRRCAGCGQQTFPRLDPAAIVAVTDDDDRLLLGRQPSWGPGRMSVLAGFVEAGESPEQAARREVLEEVGVELGQVAYFGSQPWPFPRSLMLAFTATARSVSLDLDGQEIEQADWFSRRELAGLVDGGAVILPSRHSVARRLIEAWRDEG